MEPLANIYQNILRFNVAVNNLRFMLMKIIDGIEDLVDDKFNVIEGRAIDGTPFLVRDILGKIGFEQLQNKEKLIVYGEALAQQLDDIVVIDTLQ